MKESKKFKIQLYRQYISSLDGFYELFTTLESLNLTREKFNSYKLDL